MRRKEPFIALMMLLSELKADNDSVIMAHCEYLSWKDWDKMSRHCWFAKPNSWSLGSKTIYNSNLGLRSCKIKKARCFQDARLAQGLCVEPAQGLFTYFWNLKLIVEGFFTTLWTDKAQYAADSVNLPPFRCQKKSLWKKISFSNDLKY